ncbi:MAG: DUF3857 domain-containing protein [Bacteroidota bacterium]
MKSIFRLLFILSIILGKIQTTHGQGGNPDAQFLSVVREYTLQKDGSQEYKESFSIKLLTHNAFHRMYGESFIVYNPQVQKLKIQRAETIMANGKKVQNPANAFNEVLPSWVSGSAAFSHLREMVVSHTGLEVGATIFLDYKIETQAGYFPYFSGAEVASLTSPAEAFKVIIRVPADTQLNYKVLNIRLAPEITKEKNFDVYVFNFGAVPALPQESFVPRRYSYLPAVVFSTSGNRDALLGVGSVTDAQLPPDAIRAVRELKEKAQDTPSLVAAVRNMVANELALIQVKPVYTGFKMRNLREIWESRSGTMAEKAYLLAALLREADLNATPVFALPSNVVLADLLPASLIEDFYVKTEVDGLPEILLSPISASTRDERPYLFGMSIFGKGRNGKMERTDIHPVNSEYRVEGALNIDTGIAVSGNIKVKAEGIFHPFFDLIKDKNALATTLKNIQGDKTEVTLQRSNPRRVEGSISLSEHKGLKKKGDVILLEIPHATSGVDSWNARVLTSARDVPFSLPFFVLEEYKYTITLPEGWELITPEYTREVKKDFGGVSLKLSMKGRTLEIYQAIEFIEKEISVLNYPSLREILNTWYDPGLQVLVFRKH